MRLFRTRLLEWYGLHRRELPWRSEPTPYRVWISEIMLQQTQVRTVLPYFGRFVTRFPDVKSLAAAPEDEILGLWAGLGYYSRARNLHRAARQIEEKFGGTFPDTLAGIQELPGIGRYTAGAILSIAFNRRVPIVDGNVRRVIARLHGIETAVPDSFCWEQAEAWTDDDRPSDFNQAVMELGALICTPTAPRCHACPVGSLCSARRHGSQERIPPPRTGEKGISVDLVILWLECDGRVVVTENAVGFVPGAWGPPACVLPGGHLPEEAAARLARRTAGRAVKLRALGTVRHSITFRKILGHVFCGRVSGRRELRCSAREDVHSLLTSSLYRKALARFSHQVS